MTKPPSPKLERIRSLGPSGWARRFGGTSAEGALTTPVPPAEHATAGHAAAKERLAQARAAVKAEAAFHVEIKARMAEGLSFDDAWLACGGTIIEDGEGVA